MMTMPFSCYLMLLHLLHNVSSKKQVVGGRAVAAICLRPHKLILSSYLFPRWHLFQQVGYQQQVDLWLFDHESGVRITCDVGYLCANFGLPRPLCSGLRLDVCDRQM